MAVRCAAMGGDRSSDDPAIEENRVTVMAWSVLPRTEPMQSQRTVRRSVHAEGSLSSPNEPGFTAKRVFAAAVAGWAVLEIIAGKLKSKNLLNNGVQIVIQAAIGELRLEKKIELISR